MVSSSHSAKPSEGSDMNQFDRQDFKSNLDFGDLRFISLIYYFGRLNH